MEILLDLDCICTCNLQSNDTAYQRTNGSENIFVRSYGVNDETVFAVRSLVTFHFRCVHIIFSSVSVAEWPPFGK